MFLLVVHGVLWTLSTYCSPAQVLGGDVTAVQKVHQSHSAPVVKGQGSQLIGGLSTWGLFTFDKVRGMGV